MLKQKVMVVDDDKEFLEEMGETLRLSGYEPIMVRDSRAVLDLARRALPNIILLDLKMDKMSGFQVAVNLKQASETSRIPIIAMTGYFSGDFHLPLLNVCGIKTCLSKPFKPLDIISHIEKMASKDIS